MKKITVLIIVTAFFFVLFLPSTKNSVVMATGCEVQLSSFHLYQTTLTGNRILLDPATSYPDTLVNNRQLKDGNITGYIFATQTGCDDEFSRWAGTYRWDESRPEGKEPGCSSSTSYNCIAYRWAPATGGSFPSSGNPVFTNWALGNNGIYMVRGAAYGYARDDSWSWLWTAGRLFFYEVVNNLSIDSSYRLTGSITLPWYAGVAGPNLTLPNYYLLINTDPSTLTNQSLDSSEIQIYPTWSNYKGSPDWQIDNNFSFQIQGLVPGQTYHWRIRQQGSAFTTYIPGGSYSAPGLTASPAIGSAPLTTTLTASAGTTPSQWPMTYYFWKNCSSLNNNVATLTSICGNPDYTFSNISSNSKSASFTYSVADDISYPKAFVQPSTGNTVLVGTSIRPEVPLPFKPFYSSGIIFQDKMWILSSLPHYSCTTCVASSSNGSSWTVNNGLYDSSFQSPTISTVLSTTFNSKIWMMGSYISCGIRSSSDGSSWSSVNQVYQPGGTAYCNPRYGSMVEYNNKIWLLGGSIRVDSALSGFPHVLSSTDGITWTQQGNLPFAGGQTSLVFTDPADSTSKMWVIGGYITYDPSFSSSSESDRVYSSTDGITWTLVGHLPKGIGEAISVVFDNKIWVMGGVIWVEGNGYERNNNIYSSTNGITWTLAGQLPPSFPQGGQTSLVFTDPADSTSKIWVMGTDYLSDVFHKAYVYSSSDGTNWTSRLAPCSGNMNFTLSPNPVITPQKITATVTGLSDCAGTIMKFSSIPQLGSIGQVGYCSASNIACSSELFSITDTTAPGTHTYYAIIDKNSNNTIDPGEMASATIEIQDASGAGGGGGGGAGGGGAGGATGCGDVGANNRSTGLVSTPSMSTESKFNTSGGCVQDPKAAFVPYKIPTFDDLKSLYYTQR